MRNYRSGYAIFLSGILFSVFHLNPWQMTYTFFLGLLLGWIMIKTRSLPLAIFTHALNNLIVLLTIQFEIEISESALFWLPRAENLKISIMALAIGFLLFIALTLKKEKTKITAKHD